MGRILLFVTGIIFMAAGIISCGPSAYVMNVELRQPSASGMDLVGKDMSVVFLDNGESYDSLFIATLSGSFADKLDAEYFGGDSLVTLFHLDKRDGVTYYDRDTMINLLVEAGSDVIFLFDVPDFEDAALAGETEEASGRKYYSAVFPYSVKMYAYDAMNSEDRVMEFNGNRTVSASVYIEGTESDEEKIRLLKEQLLPEAEKMGSLSGDKFTIQWKEESVYFYVYDSQRWYDSYYAVNDYRWQDAMDIWMSMLDTKNLQKKACLEHNLAVACYIQGQYELADQWIKLSAKDCDLPLTKNTASKITSKL